jgi:hypothetical protein
VNWNLTTGSAPEAGTSNTSTLGDMAPPGGGMSGSPLPQTASFSRSLRRDAGRGEVDAAVTTRMETTPLSSSPAVTLVTADWANKGAAHETAPRLSEDVLHGVPKGPPRRSPE